MLKSEKFNAFAKKIAEEEGLFEIAKLYPVDEEPVEEPIMKKVRKPRSKKEATE